MTEHTVRGLASPNLNLNVRQEGNFIIFNDGLPRSSGSVSESPFLEVTRNELPSLLNGAQSAFLEKLNGSGIEYRPIDINTSGTAGVGASGRLPSRLASAEFAVEITSEVRGGINILSGRVGEAIVAAQENYDETRNGVYKERARQWATETGGLGVTSTNPHTGDSFKVSAEVAGAYYNNQLWWLDPRRLDLENLSQNNPSATIASAETGLTAKDFGERGNHFNQALSAANGNADVAAAVVRSSAAAGHNPKDEINVAVSTKDGALIATQGAGPGANRAEPVLASQVQQGTAQNVAEALTQKSSAQQTVAAIEQQPDQQQRASRTV